MPHKYNADRRDEIPKQKYCVTNWSEYNEGLRRRGDLTAMQLQSQNAVGQAGLLVGRDRLLRLTTSPTLAPIALDDFERARDELPIQAQRLVEENAERLEAFFDAKRAPVEFYHGKEI